MWQPLAHLNQCYSSNSMSFTQVSSCVVSALYPRTLRNSLCGSYDPGCSGSHIGSGQSVDRSAQLQNTLWKYALNSVLSTPLISLLLYYSKTLVKDLRDSCGNCGLGFSRSQVGSSRSVGRSPQLQNTRWKYALNFILSTPLMSLPLIYPKTLGNNLRDMCGLGCSGSHIGSGQSVSTIAKHSGSTL